MEIPPNMEHSKKVSRNSGQLAKNGQDTSKAANPEFVSKKNGSQYARKREQDKNGDNNGRRSASNRGGRSGQRYVRTREKVGGQISPNEEEEFSEFGSLQHGGGKKQNIAHLLNWWAPTDTRTFGGRNHRSGAYLGQGRKSYHSARYNKEHFLQANCQFVVRSGEDYSTWQTNPDNLVEWGLVEEVRLHVSDEPSCPICLYTPTSAKVTRCGHVFCFPCILHYLALSDEKWRKCPICYEAIVKDDLKSVLSIVHKDLNCGETVNLILMRRERDSLVPCPVWSFDPGKQLKTIGAYADPTQYLGYSKLVAATGHEVVDSIIKREVAGLEFQLGVEGDQPEACFIQEALALVLSRKDQLLASSPAQLENVDNTHVKTSQKGFKNARKDPHNRQSIHYQETDFNVGKKCYDQEILADGTTDLTNLCTAFSGKLDLNKSLLNRELIEKSVCSGGGGGVHTPISPLEDYQLEQTVKADDLDISQFQNTQKMQSSQGAIPKSTPFYFYQAASGAQVYLHALNVHMLVTQYGSLQLCPHTINARILEKESANMTTELRKRLRYLTHLPVTCAFDVVEIDLPEGIVSDAVLEEYAGQLKGREQKRRKRVKEETKISRRNQREDRMMGKSHGKYQHLESFAHFPTFQDDAYLSSGEDPPLCEGASASVSLSTSASDSEWPCSPCLSSFAQVISSGKTPVKPKANWPSLGATTTPTMAIPSTTTRTRTSSMSDEENEAEKAPDFNSSFSVAFAKALDKVKTAVPETPQNENVGKKKRKKKGIVLLSSGGR